MARSSRRVFSRYRLGDRAALSPDKIPFALLTILAGAQRLVPGLMAAAHSQMQAVRLLARRSVTIDRNRTPSAPDDRPSKQDSGKNNDTFKPRGSRPLLKAAAATAAASV